MSVSDIAQSGRAHDLLACLDAAAGGDRRAVHALVAECRPAVARFAASRGSNEPDVIADTVMLELLARLDRLRFETQSHLWAYLYRIARSRIADERRRRQPECPIGDGRDDESSGGVQFEHDVVERLWMRDLLADLTDDQRQVLELRFLDDLSIEETATRTGRTLTAVKALQRRAIRAVAAGMVAVLAIVVYALGSGGDRSAVTISSSEGSRTSVTSPDRGDNTSGALEATDPDAAPPTLSPERSNDASSKAPSIMVPGPVTVDAGADQTTKAKETVQLKATATQEQADLSTRPVDGEWTQVSGPADAVLTTTGGGQAEATFAQPGQYVFQFTATEGESDQVTVTVGEPDPTYNCWGLSGTVAELTSQGYQVVIGTDGDDVIDLPKDGRPAVVFGLGGNDTITTGAGDDRVCGGNGNDTIKTGAGNDRVNGDNGNDSIWGGDGVDRINGNAGNDRLWGENQNDILIGGGENDVLNGGAGDDTLLGSQGDDQLLGGAGNDKLRGEDGLDTLQGGDGNGDQCDLGTDSVPAAAAPAAAATTAPTTTAKPASTTTTIVESADASCESVLSVGSAAGASSGTSSTTLKG